jgi:hypothetical protein
MPGTTPTNAAEALDIAAQRGPPSLSSRSNAGMLPERLLLIVFLAIVHHFFNRTLALKETAYKTSQQKQKPKF